MIYEINQTYETGYCQRDITFVGMGPNKELRIFVGRTWDI